MIAKISATENLGGALGYNFKKVEKEEVVADACNPTSRVQLPTIATPTATGIE